MVALDSACVRVPTSTEQPTFSVRIGTINPPNRHCTGPFSYEPCPAMSQPTQPILSALHRDSGITRRAITGTPTLYLGSHVTKAVVSSLVQLKEGVDVFVAASPPIPFTSPRRAYPLVVRYRWKYTRRPCARTWTPLLFPQKCPSLRVSENRSRIGVGFAEFCLRVEGEAMVSRASLEGVDIVDCVGAAATVAGIGVTAFPQLRLVLRLHPWRGDALCRQQGSRQ